MGGNIFHPDIRQNFILKNLRLNNTPTEKIADYVRTHKNIFR